MPLPGDLTTITVTGEFLDGAGRPQGGEVAFWPDAELTDSSGRVIIAAAPVTAAVNPDTGQFSQVLACTDNANLQPAGWQWKIQVSVAGALVTFTAAIPSTLGSSVDLSTLAPPGTLPGTTS